MKTLPRKNQATFTLKQYLQSNSLRKKVTSRNKSIEQNSEKSPPPAGIKNGQISTGKRFSCMNKQELIEQIKLKMVQIILKDCHLATLMNMFDRLLQIFRVQIQGHLQEKVVLASVIKENLFINQTSYKASKRNKNQCSLDNEKDQHKNQKHNTLKLPQNSKFHPKSNSMTSSEDIPNINLLLVTKNRENQHLQSEIQTKNIFQDNQSYLRIKNQDSLMTTFNAHNRTNSKGSSEDLSTFNVLLMTKHQASSHHQNEFNTKATLSQNQKQPNFIRTMEKQQTSFFTQFNNKQKIRKLSFNSNASKQQNPQINKKIQENSQIRFSVHSNLWNNSSVQTSAMNRFQEFKWKSKR